MTLVEGDTNEKRDVLNLVLMVMLMLIVVMVFTVMVMLMMIVEIMGRYV